MIKELRVEPGVQSAGRSPKALPCWVVSVGVHGLLGLCLLFGFDRRGLPDGSGAHGLETALTLTATFGVEQVPGNGAGEVGVDVAGGTASDGTAESADPSLPPSQELPPDTPSEADPETVTASSDSTDSSPMPDTLLDAGPAVPEPPENSAAELVTSTVSPGRNARQAVARRPASTGDPAEGDGQGSGGGEGGATPGGGRGAGFGSPDGASFFQISAQGQHFCYVVDCSNSMEEDNTIGVARQELIASLQRLDVGKRFQILFYDAELHPLTNGSETVFPITASNRRLARQFINSQQPTGRALHRSALLYALRSQPDVIFFLTDGEVPELTARDLSDLKSSNRRRTQINVVEFGRGAKLEHNWLEQLARDHRGHYRYRDIDAEATESPGG